MELPVGVEVAVAIVSLGGGDGVRTAPALMCGAPETRPGILSMQGHREPLAEHDGAGAFGLELAVGQGRRLGKRGPNSPGDFSPATANGFNNHG